MRRWRLEVGAGDHVLIVCEPRSREEAADLFTAVVPAVRATPGTGVTVTEDGEPMYTCHHQPAPRLLAESEQWDVLRRDE